MGACPCMTRTSKIPHSDLFIPRFDVTVNQVHQKKLMRLRSLKSRQKKETKAFKEMSTEKYIRAKALFRNTVKSSTVNNLMSLNSIEAKKRPGITSALTGGGDEGKYPQKAATNQFGDTEYISPVSIVAVNKVNVNGISNAKGNNSVSTNGNNNNNCVSCSMDNNTCLNNNKQNSSFKNNNNSNNMCINCNMHQSNNMLNRLTTKQSNSELSHLKNIECDITEQLFSSNEELFIANVLLRHYLFHRATDEILNYLFSEISEFQIEEDAPIFYEGDEGTCMFMIKKGQVELTQKDTNQKFILTDGEVFGEAGLIREGNRRTYTARSISYLEFYIIDINAYKEVAEKLMKPNKYVFDLFEYFDEPYKDNINLLCAENELKKGTTVTDLNGVFAIESGKIMLLDKHGKEISTYKPGDIYGVYDIFMDDERGTALRRDSKNGIENKLSVGEDSKCFIVSYIAFIEVFGLNYQEQIRKMVYVNMIKKNKYFNAFFSSCDVMNVYTLFTVQEYKKNEIIQNVNEEKENENVKKIKLIVNGHISTLNKQLSSSSLSSSIGRIIGENYLSGKTIKNDYYVDSPKVVCLECKWITLKESIIVSDLNMNLYTLIEILKNFHFFYGVHESTLIQHAFHFKEASFEENETIIPSTKPNDKVYFIISGKAALIDQKETIKIFTEGNTFGYLTIFLNTEPKWDIISIMNDTHCYYLEKDTYYTLISDAYLNMKLRKMICLSDVDIFPNALYYLNTIYKGTNSKVYLVHNKHCLYTLKAVCIKGVNKTKKTDAIVNKVIHEKKAMKYLNHPFMITYVKTLKSNRWCFFIEEFIQGITLQEYIDMGKPLNDISITKFYGACLFIILDTLYTYSLMHRNIKPHNLIMESTGYIKLIDFSSCKLINKIKPAKTTIGTPYYIAPEVLHGKGYNYKCDYWSVGIMLYVLYYGEYPFGAKATSPEVVYKEIVNKKLTFPNTDVPNKELETLLIGLLKKKEKKRICCIKNIYEIELYSGFNWDRLKRMEMEPPFIPQVVKINQDKLLKNYTQPFNEFIMNEKVIKNTGGVRLDKDIIITSSMGENVLSNGKESKTKDKKWFDMF